MNSVKSAGSLILLAFGLALAGCSVGVFSDGKDKSVLQQKPYRPVNPACAQIDIQNSGVSVPQFRGLLACLNANGSLGPIQKLTDQMSDDELLPLVRVGNEQFFKNPVYLYQFQETYAQWSRSGTLEDDIESIGGLLRNEAFATSALAILARTDARFFPALKLLATQLEPTKVEGMLHAMIAITESPAFSSLARQLKTPGDDPHSRQEMARAVYAYVRSQREPGRVDLDRRLLDSLASGKLFRILDEFSATLSAGADVRETVSKMAALIRVLSAPEPTLFSRGDAGLLRAIMRLVHGLHLPIPCLKGSQTVPDAVLYIFGELASRSTQEADRFLRRDNVLNMSLVNSVCEYPKALKDHYGAFQQLASTDVLFTATELSKAFYRNGQAELLIDSLGGEGVGPGIGSALETPLLELLPVMAELDNRGAFEDLLLIAASIRPQDRQVWQDAIRFVVLPRSELDGLSIYDVLYSVLSVADVELIEELLSAVARFLDSDELTFARAFRSFRYSLLMNDVHPILERVKFLLESPQLNRDFFESLFLMARKWPKEFSEALSLLGEMTRKEDGRFKDVLDATIRIFSKFSERGASSGPVLERNVVPLESSKLRAHSWSRADISVKAPVPLPPWRGCEGLTPGVRLDQYESPGYQDLLKKYLDCLDSDGSHGEIVQNLFLFLIEHRLPNGRPVLHQIIDAVREMEISPQAIREGLQSFFDAYDNGQLNRWVDALPWWLTRTLPATREGVPAGTWAESLLVALSKTLPATDGALQNSVKLLEERVGLLIRRDSFPRAVGHLLDVTETQTPVTPFQDQQSFELAPFQEVLAQYECVSDPGQQRRRAEELVADYRESVVGSVLDPQTRRPPRSWDSSGLKTQIAPILDKLAQPSQGFLPEGLGQFLKTLTLEPGQQPSEGRLRSWTELRDWLQLRANDWRVIPYFYPDEKTPRAKVVNSLDLLELLLLNSDFKFVLPDNFALKFLTIVALAWGDEPREVWPPLIQQMYPGKKRPLTLREAYDEILGTLKLSETFIGYPKLPNCRGGSSISGIFPSWLEARIFNMRQLVGVIEEGLPGAQGQRAGGMRILRDLLFSIYQSTPEKHRKFSSGWNNNLSFAIRLSQLGAFRQISRGVRLAGLDENQGSAEGSEMFSRLIEGLVKGLGGARGADLIRGLVRDDPDHVFFFKLWDEGVRILSDTERAPQLSESILYALGALRSPGFSGPFTRVASDALRTSRAEVQETLPLILDLLSSDQVRSGIRNFSSRSGQPEFEDLWGVALADLAPGRSVVTEGMKLVRAARTPEALATWQTVGDRWDLIQQDPDYLDLGVGELSREILYFFAERRPGATAAPREIRQFIAGTLERGELSLWVESIAQDPAAFSRMLDAVGKTSLSGELKDLLRTFRRALPDPRSLTLDARGLENSPHVHSHH